MYKKITLIISTTFLAISIPFLVVGEEQEIALADVPDNVIAAAKAKISGLVIAEAEIEREKNSIEYELEGSANKVDYEIEVEVNNEGKVIKVEIEEDT